MNSNFKIVFTTITILLFINSSFAGKYYERHRERGILGLGLDLLGVRPAYAGGYGGYGNGYGHRPVVSQTSYYGYPAYGNGYGGYGNQGYGGYGNQGYGGYGHQGAQGYGYLDRPYGSGYGGYNDGYGHGRVPIRVKTVIKSKHDW